MNIFRLFGDMSHLLAIAVLVWKIWKTRSCAGISGKAQGLFALVFATRYLDLFTTFLSFYNSGMKVLFLTGALGTVYLIFVKFKATYDNLPLKRDNFISKTSSIKLDKLIKRRHHDTFRVIYLIIPCAAMAFLVNHDFTPIEIMWTFSIYLESVAIMPQLFMLSKTGQAETITSHYLFLLGMYRALYICNWVYRYHLDDYFDPIAVVAGVIQTILYADFFYLYITRVLQGGGAIQLSA